MYYTNTKNAKVLPLDVCIRTNATLHSRHDSKYKTRHYAFK